MKKILLITIIFMSLLVQTVLADFYYSPMNFEPSNPINHSFEINLAGTINATLPAEFTLVSGSLTGNNNLSFIINGNGTSNTSDLYIGQIYVDNVLYSNFYLLGIEDSKIVDVKIEMGHGDFNYIDYNSDIGTDESLLFTLVRVWGVGSDIWNTPAENVRFNCTFPDYLPRTVDSKYTTTYNTNDILAQGELSRLEGISLFRIFVLSQEFSQEVGTSYNVSCSNLVYDFPNTQIIAEIPDINLNVRSLSPLVINMVNNSGYVTFTIMNNETYDLQDLEFIWTVGTDTIREEKQELSSGAIVQYQIEVNDSGNIGFMTRFIPEWMFNSRSPTAYEQFVFESYVAGSLFSQLNSSNYYNNQTIETPNILETTLMHFKINTLQNSLCDDDNLYRVTYYFYNDNGAGELSATEEVEIVAINNHDIYFANSNLNPTDSDKKYAVYTKVSMKDEECVWQDFDRELIGSITVTPLTTRTIESTIGLYDVIINVQYDKYGVGETIIADISIINNGDTADADTILIYYLENADGTRFGETREQLLVVPVGTTVLKRSLSLPLNSAPGEWAFNAEYLTTIQPVVQVYDSLEVISGYSIFNKGNDRLLAFIDGNYILSFIFLVIFIFLLLVLILYLTFKRKRRK